MRDWLARNAPPQPRWKLPDSFMEVGTREQFEYLRDWQAKVYAAGYLGMSWPKRIRRRRRATPRISTS